MHVEVSGRGAPLLLIHGWGMHGGMWGSAVEELAGQFCVQVVDLPGHGKSRSRVGSSEQDNAAVLPYTPPYNPSLDSIVDEMSARFEEPLTVCGWSLGSQVALRWAQREPKKIQRLVLVSGTPCFVQKPDWPCAMAAETLAEFATALSENHALTLRRFLALQVRGSESERELLASLRAALFSRGEPDLSALQTGLEILRDCDLRAVLRDIAQPTLIIAGERDTLTPVQASEHMANVMRNARLATIKGAAHAPFLSHPEIFVEQLTRFLHE